MGEIVYFKTDLEQRPYLVVGIVERMTEYNYLVSHVDCPEVEAREIEITRDRDMSLIIFNN